MLLGCRKLPPCSQERRDANHSRPCLACHLPATACLLAVRLPNGGVGLLLRCRVYDGRGRMYGVQQACLYRLRPQPSPRRPPRPPVLQQATAGVLRPGLTTPRGMQARVLQQAGQEEQQQELQRHVPAQEPATGPDLVWQGFIEMPGGGNKFVVRYDAVSRRYLALTNPSIDRYGSNPDARNVLVLVRRCC